MISHFGKKQKEARFGKNVWLKIAGICFLIFTVFLLYQDIKIFLKKKELSEKVGSYQKQIEEVKESNQLLKEKIANSDNVDYIEKVAYEQLDQQRPGERQIIFLMPEDKQEKQNSQQNVWEPGFWTAWISKPWDWIKSKF